METAQFFEGDLGLTPGLLFAALAGGTDFLAASSRARPHDTFIGPLALRGLMAYAAFAVHLGNGFFWTAGGLEYPVCGGSSRSAS